MSKSCLQTCSHPESYKCQTPSAVKRVFQTIEHVFMIKKFYRAENKNGQDHTKNYTSGRLLHQLPATQPPLTPPLKLSTLIITITWGNPKKDTVGLTHDIGKTSLPHRPATPQTAPSADSALPDLIGHTPAIHRELSLRVPWDVLDVCAKTILGEKNLCMKHLALWLCFRIVTIYDDLLIKFFLPLVVVCLILNLIISSVLPILLGNSQLAYCWSLELPASWSTAAI